MSIKPSFRDGGNRCGLLLATCLLIAPGCQRIEVVEESGASNGNHDPPPPRPPTALPETPEETDEETEGVEPSWFPDLPPGFGDPGLEGCDKVDLLFVIDNSSSMLTEQEQLVGSFPTFISHIEQYLVEENDYHIGIVTTDSYSANAEGCRQLGALVTETNSQSCGPFAAGRYITADDDLDTAFSCAAHVGIEGELDERQVEAALRAVGPALNADGGCNEGFIRDDALLVLVIISDEDDDGIEGSGGGSPGEPVDWFEELVELKGHEDHVVVLALVGQEPPNACEGLSLAKGGSEPADRIREFAAGFPFHLWGDVCEENYGSFFADTLSIIQDACQDFEPTP